MNDFASGRLNDFARGRLIDAAATLDPADRALWNLWVNRGLDDASVARMTGMSSETIAGRRARVVEHLGAMLDQSPQDVLTALTEIVPFHDVPLPVARDAAVANRSATLVPDLETESSSQHRRRLWMAFGLLVVVGAVVLVISLSSSAPGHPGQRMVTLPGGPARATGSVHVIGKRPDLRLDLSVSQLPDLPHGHYEVWLYDSVVNSEALGRLPTGGTHLSVRLPADAGRYHWIDVSVQPAEMVFHSGESVLRSANPRFARAVAQHR